MELIIQINIDGDAFQPEETEEEEGSNNYRFFLAQSASIEVQRILRGNIYHAVSALISQKCHDWHLTDFNGNVCGAITMQPEENSNAK